MRQVVARKGDVGHSWGRVAGNSNPLLAKRSCGKFGNNFPTVDVGLFQAEISADLIRLAQCIPSLPFLMGLGGEGFEATVFKLFARAHPNIGRVGG